MVATVNWPLTLPKRFLPQGLSYGLKPSAVFTEPEVGPARSRRRSTGRTYLFTGRLPLERDVPDPVTGLPNNQVQLFLDFVHDTIKGGSIRFNWVDPNVPPAGYELPTFTVDQYDVECLMVSAGDPVVAPAWITVYSHLVSISLEIYKD